MKRTISLLLAMTLVFAYIPATPMQVNAETNEYYTYTVADDEATITGCDQSIRGSITIPSELDGHPVTGIGDWAFSYCDSLTNVVIPDSVTSIGEAAFWACSSLKNIEIPDSVTSIGYDAFCKCSSLTGIWVDEDNANYSSDSYGVLFNKDKTTLVRAPGAISDYTIPDSVTTIGDVAFTYCYNLTNIEIPDNVTGIGDGAFQHCGSLMGVEIPDSVISIGVSAFGNCRSLRNVVIGDNVASIGYDAFADCGSLIGIWVDEDNANYSSDSYGVLFNKEKTTLVRAPGALTDYTIPDSVTTIGEYAFSWCGGLASVVIPDSVTSIDEYAFHNCSYLSSITIPDSVTSIGGYAFYDCSNLTSVVISDGVLGIGDFAFHGCNSLLSIQIPDSVTSIGEYAFDSCYKLASVVISDSITSIDYRAFAECRNLTSITIPDGVTSIGGYAFHYCTNLASVEIPDSVTDIDWCAFAECGSLKDVYYDGTEGQWNEINIGFMNECLTNATIHFSEEVSADDTIQEYLTWEVTNGEATITKCGGGISGDIILPDTLDGYPVTGIGEGAFYNCDTITGVTIPDSITIIGEGAFSECSNLMEIVIPDSVVTLNRGAFKACTKLTSVTIGNSVTKIPNNAFDACTGLSNVIIGNSVTAIGEYAFSSCHSLTNVVIPDSVISIGYAAFNSCKKLTHVTIGNGVTELGNQAFSNCGLVSVTMGNSVINIGDGAFNNCADLTEISISDGVNSIGQSAFKDCVSLTVISIPDSVTSIGNYAFNNCTSLNSVIVGNGVTAIGRYAFTGCESLTDVVLGSSLARIEFSAFGYCTNLTDIKLPDGVNYIGENAFDTCSALESITIPASVNTIDSFAFNGCTALTDVYYGGTEEQWNAINISFVNECLTNATIHFNHDDSEDNEEVESNYDIITVDPVLYPESDHDYGSELEEFKTFTWDGAEKLVITFSDETRLEDNYDYLYLYDKTGAQIAQYTGAQAAGQTIEISGDAFTIKLVSDFSVERYGYSFSSIVAYMPKTESCEEYLSWDITDGNAIIVGCDPAASGNIVIPATLDGYPVTTIDEWAFYDCSNLESVTIPASVTTVFGSAFSGCSALTGIWVDGNSPYYSSDDYGVLFNKDQTTLVAAPNGISGSYTIPDSVTYIDNCAFSGCSSLVYLNVPDSVARIGYEVLCDCTSLVYNIYENARYLGNAENPYVVFIGSDAQEMTATTIHKDTKVIFERAFSDRSDLQTIYIPDGVRSIGQDAFAWCSGLTEITIPGSVLSIDHCAFFGCTNLESITIPDSVTRIGEGVFYNCDSLTMVYYQGTEEQRANIEIGDSNDILLNATWIYEEDSADDTIREYLNWEVENGEIIITGYSDSISGDITIPATLDGYPVTGIGDYAFYGNMNLTSIEIPNSITSIGVCAFDACPGLTDIYYSGTQAQWNAITIYSGNAHLTNATIHTQAAVEHEYIVNGEVVTAEYDTLEEALATVTGGTIKLLANETAVNVILKSGVTLDLNGYTLTANLFVAMNGATITDGGDACTGGGLLRVPSENMAYARDDGQGVIPVWNGVDGYVFTKVTFQQMARTAGSDAAQYIFLPAFSNPDATALLADGGWDNAVNVKVCLTWNNGQCQQFYTYGEDLVAQVFASGGRLVFSLTVTGISGITDMVASPVVVTDTGAQATNVSIPITAS